MQNWWKDQWGNSPIKSDCTSTTPLLRPLRSEPLALESHWNWARKIMIQQVGVQVKFDAVCVCVFGCGCGYIKVWVCWQLPWGVAKRSLCTILRTGSKMSECRDFKWPELWPQETRGCLDWFLHHYVWHMRSLLISVQICIQSSEAVYPLFTCLPSKKL